MNRILVTTCAAWLGLIPFGLNTSLAEAEIQPVQKQEIEKIVRDFLLANPEILREMSNKLQEQDQIAEDRLRSEGLKQNADIIFRSPADPVTGNPKGDVTVVEFIDYNCGWCKKSLPEMLSLVTADKNIRLVTKQFPIFGEGSEYAARAALAAQRQNKFDQLHQALYSQQEQITAEVVDRVAQSIGINVVQMKKDIESEDIATAIATNLELGKVLKIEGTPAFIVDEKILPGFIASAVLAQDVASVRTKGGCKLC
jgi:protein-disulfide isomerase